MLNVAFVNQGDNLQNILYFDPIGVLFLIKSDLNLEIHDIRL